MSLPEEIPLNAQALMARKANKSVDAMFNTLPENLKWEWLLYSTNHHPDESVKYVDVLNIRADYARKNIRA